MRGAAVKRQRVRAQRGVRVMRVRGGACGSMRSVGRQKESARRCAEAARDAVRAAYAVYRLPHLSQKRPTLRSSRNHP